MAASVGAPASPKNQADGDHADDRADDSQRPNALRGESDLREGCRSAQEPSSSLPIA